MYSPDPIDLKDGHLYQVSPGYDPWRPDISKWDSLIVVATPKGLSEALQAGWPRPRILIPQITALEGRRWRRMVMTWTFVEKHAGTDLFELIQSHQITYQSEVRIDHIRRESEIWNDES